MLDLTGSRTKPAPSLCPRLTHPAFALRRETFSWKILPRVVKSSPTPPEDSDLELHLDGSHLCLLGENSGQREAPLQPHLPFPYRLATAPLHQPSELLLPVSCSASPSCLLRVSS